MRRRLFLQTLAAHLAKQTATPNLFGEMALFLLVCRLLEYWSCYLLLVLAFASLFGWPAQDYRRCLVLLAATPITSGSHLAAQFPWFGASRAIFCVPRYTFLSYRGAFKGRFWGPVKITLPQYSGFLLTIRMFANFSLGWRFFFSVPQNRQDLAFGCWRLEWNSNLPSYYKGP